MRFEHPAHPGLGVQLGYGLNLHPCEDVPGVLAGLRSIAGPLAARFPRRAGRFGIGAYLPARAALDLCAPGRAGELERFLDLLAELELDPFTANAFPFGGFHRPGLKQRVFEPDWLAPQRLEFTLAVARLLVRARRRNGGSRAGQHLSLSTHAGKFAPDLAPGDRERLAAAFAGAACALARLEEESGERVVLALEPEPRSSANDACELAGFLELVRARASLEQRAALERHLGSCLDACHAAVEFEPPASAFEQATAGGTLLGKLQFSSAIALRAPDRDHAGRTRFLALDEPVFLHQATGRRGRELARALDLSELERRWQAGDPGWRGCDEWRCHFHVPVDLPSLPGAEGGLGTTRAEAQATLRTALERPERWGLRELHVEIETYTWTLLAGPRGGELLDGLERELTHVRSLLAAAGWVPAGAENGAR
jgi:hypothetical protein